MPHGENSESSSKHECAGAEEEVTYFLRGWLCLWAPWQFTCPGFSQCWQSQAKKLALLPLMKSGASQSWMKSLYWSAWVKLLSGSWQGGKTFPEDNLETSSMVAFRSNLSVTFESKYYMMGIFQLQCLKAHWVPLPWTYAYWAALDFLAEPFKPAAVQ